jgi:carotenoid cleavage dioxygenase
MASTVEKLIRKTVTKGVLQIAAYNRSRMRAPDTAHPFLSGIHSPMTSELTLDDLAVEGRIPPGLDGRYVRIGPNPVKPPNPGAYHWFAGDGMVHGVRLQGGRALWYRNRWIRSNAVSAALGEPPAPGRRAARSDNANTNVLGHAGRTWALVEAGAMPVELDEDLHTVAHNPFDDSLQGSFSAHPHLDPETGELHAICYNGPDLTTIRHVVVGRDGRVRREEPIEVSHGPSIHDCMITRNYMLVFDLPVTFSMKTLLAGHSFPYAWNPAHPARVGLLPREGRGSDIIWCAVDPCYVFHPCNAYELDDGRVIVDVVAHATMFAASTQGPDSKTVMFERWMIDPKAQRVERKVIDPLPQEFPRMDERRTGRPYRYAYAVPLAREDASFMSGAHLIRHDLETGERAVHEFGPHRYPGEFVFVPRHADAKEDEGWLMGYVVNMQDPAAGPDAAEMTELVIIDAQDFTGTPRAVITIPHRVPPGFHGNWISA